MERETRATGEGAEYLSSEPYTCRVFRTSRPPCTCLARLKNARCAGYSSVYLMINGFIDFYLFID